ncbi:MAG: VWA-like domain-containing protein [Polyangiales bacterium]
MADWRGLFDQASRTLLVREPFYGHLLVGLNKRAADMQCLVRLAPSARQVLFEVNAPRWIEASNEQRLAALRHELVHLILRHPLRAKEKRNAQVWGMACDLVVNQLVDTKDLEAPLTVENVELPGGLLADEYYALLLSIEERRCCGESCAGGSKINEWCEKNGARSGAHSRWQDFADLPSGTLSVLDTNVEDLLKVVVKRTRTRRKSWGYLPGRLVSVLSELGAPAQLPWRRLLRLFIAQSGRTQIRSTLSRASKRYGTVPGTKVRRRHLLTVAIDTSGSIADADLEVFFAEIYAIWRRGATVQIVEADAAVARTYLYKGVTPKAVVGRGGTDFNAAIRWSNEHRADGLVYFTDGHASRPHVKSRCPLLWVVTEDGSTDVLPGRTVQLSL